MISTETMEKLSDDNDAIRSANEDPLSSQTSVASSLDAVTQTQNLTSLQRPCAYVVPMIHCRLVNFEPITPLKNLKANYYGKG